MTFGILDATTLRAWAWHKQGLDGSLIGKDAPGVLGSAGWARSVGGANPYLTLFARSGLRREQVDADVAELRIHELPVARGCTYVLCADDFGWALQLGRAAAEASVKVLKKLDVSRAEVTSLEQDVMSVLRGSGPLDPRELKDLLGGAVRSLGDEGKKRGASTTLPTALGLLQADGRIRRVPVNGRLDQQRYAYSEWNLEPSALSPEETRERLMRRYLGWTGGATLKQAQWFTGFTVAQSKAALQAASAVEVSAPGGESLWMLQQDHDAISAFRTPVEEQIQLLAGTDSLVLLRRNSADLFAEADKGKRVLDSTLALLADLPDHPILDRGRIIGLWQYDPTAERIAYWTFDKPTKAVAERIGQVEECIREDLGDFRSFSLDSAASRQKRIEALDAAGR
jgi:hypothetical protein